MKIIALRGEGRKGKTSTLIIVYEVLKKRGLTVVEYEALPNNDFRTVLKDSLGNLIGIVSQGDYAIGSCSVKNHLKWAETKGCTKTICACTLGPHKEKIEGYIASFPDHCFIDKTIEMDSSKQVCANNKDAVIIETYI